MSRALKTKHRTVRIRDDDWVPFGHAAMDADSDRSALIKQFIAWYLARPDAELPQRPPSAPVRG